jgi:hypothetical protein
VHRSVDLLELWRAERERVLPQAFQCSQESCVVPSVLYADASVANMNAASRMFFDDSISVALQGSPHTSKYPRTNWKWPRLSSSVRMHVSGNDVAEYPGPIKGTHQTH